MLALEISLSLALLAWLPCTLAQDFSIPPQWIKTTSSIPRDDRIQRAQDVLNSLAQSYDPDSGLIKALQWGQNAHLLSATAIHDLVASTSINRDSVNDRYSRTISRLIPAPNSTAVKDPLMWGLAAVHGYRAYQDRSLLDQATSIWGEITPFMITAENADTGSHPLRAATFKSKCNDISVAGGLFYSISNTTDLRVTAAGLGTYMALSAYLYEATNNQTYLEAASLSQKFIQAHLTDASTSCIKDLIFLNDCSYPNNFIITYNTGLYLEGITVLGHTTNDTNLIHTADELSLKTPIAWSQNGVIPGHANNRPNDESVTWHGMLIRGLHEHWARSPQGSDVANLIQAFMLIQYNSLVGNAQTPGKPWYSPSWTGPSLPSMLPWGQLGAIDVLNSAINMAVDNSTTTTSIYSMTPTPTGTSLSGAEPSSDPSTSHKTAVGPIIGGIIGGVVLLGLLIAIIFIILRRRRRKTQPTQYLIQEGNGSRFKSSTHTGTHDGAVNSHPVPFGSTTGDSRGSDSQYLIQPYSIGTYTSNPSSPNIERPVYTAPPRYKDSIQ